MININNLGKYPWNVRRRSSEPFGEQVCFIAQYFSLVFNALQYCIVHIVCLRVWVCCQWLKLHCSDEPVTAWGLQSTLCHVRAAGCRLTRCPGSWRLCPAVHEWRWHKEGPAVSPVCSLCLPFSSCPWLWATKGSGTRRPYGIRWTRHSACPLFPFNPNAL